jgi:hypothetical protein
MVYAATPNAKNIRTQINDWLEGKNTRIGEKR